MAQSQMDPVPSRSTTRSYISVKGVSTTGYKQPTNYMETLIHITRAYLGPTIFAVGAAFKDCGILLGPILLVHLGLINLHCQHLLMKACTKIAAKEREEVFPSFAETIQYAFEDCPFRILRKFAKFIGFVTNILLLSAQYGYCVIFFNFVSQHFTEFAVSKGWNVDYRLMLVIILVPMWLSIFLTNLKSLIPLSFVANVLMLVGIFIIIFYSAKDLGPLPERNLIADYKKLPLFFGITVHCFEGIIFVEYLQIINLRVEMRDPEDFLKPFGVLNMGSAIVIVVHMIVGFFTYWKYGEDIEGSAFLNIDSKETLANATKIMIAIAVLFSYSLHMYIPFEIGYPVFHRRFGPFRHPVLTICLYKSFWVIVTYAIANVSNNLAAFISLFGAFLGSILALFLPAVLELMLDSEHPKNYVIVKNSLIIALAVFGSILGTTCSIFQIFEEYTNRTFF